MNSPSSKDPATSNPGLDYAPLWARDRARPVLGEPVSLPVEKWPRNEIATQASRDSLDDLACYLRALKRIGIVCAVAAIVFVAAAVLLLLNPKQNAHKGLQADALPPWATSENQALASAEAVRIVPGLADERSPVASTPPPQSPQRDGPAATAPPQTIASTPSRNQSPLNVAAPPRLAIIQPAVKEKEPAPQPVESISAGSDTSAKADALPPWATSENQALASAEAVRIVPGLADERSPVASTPPPQRPQRDGPAATAPPQTIASTRTPNQSPLNVDAPPRPAITQPAAKVKEPAPQPVESISAGSDTSAKAHVAAIPEQQSEASPASKQPLPKPTVTPDDNEIQMLIKRGNNLFKDGDFAAARLLFERAAKAGSAEAALALGSTYDPSVIKQLGAVSVTPDLDRALKWYETAADRGSADAADRYANLMRAR